MKLNSQKEEVLLSNVEGRGEFRIRNSAKAFSILSSGLYSDKIKAIVRELSCNAYDSHVQAGKVDTPFSVHLPNALEPYFSVRDYGVGLDNHEVENIYTTYFESTKTDSNDYIGALGLGSKSPFSYTDNFTVTATKDGVRRIYSAYINEDGVPSIALMSEGSLSELTEDSEDDLSDGVEVRLSVKDTDFHKFSDAANSVFKWFKDLPEVTGSPRYYAPRPTYHQRDVSKGIHHIQESYAIALQGNIAYPLYNVPNAEENFGDLSKYLHEGFIFEFDIGELDIAASREKLSYIPMTIESIKNKLKELDASIRKFVFAEIDACSTKWEKMIKCGSFSQGPFSDEALKYLKTNHPFLGQETVSFNQGYYLKKDTFSDDELKVRVFSCQCWTNTIKPFEQQIWDDELSGHVAYDPILYSDKTMFIINDTKHGFIARTRYNVAHSHNSPIFKHRGHLVMLDPIDKDNPDEVLTKFFSLIGDPPLEQRIYVSALPKKERISDGVVKKCSVMEIVSRKKTPGSYYSDNIWAWDTCNINFEDEDEDVHYYIPLNNRSVIYPEKWKDSPGSFDTFARKIVDIRKYLDESITFSSHKVGNIYGVRKSNISEMEKLDNWVNFFDYLEETLRKIDYSVFEYLSYPNVVDESLLHSYMFKCLGVLSDESEFKKFFDFDYSLIESASNKENILLSLKYFLEKIDIKVSITDREEELTVKYNELQIDYPLIKHFSVGWSCVSSAYPALIDYIRLRDKETILKEKGNE